MFPFENSMQQQCMADCYSNFGYGYAPTYYYGNSNYSWPYDYSNQPNYALSYSFTAPTEEGKCPTQSTRGTVQEEEPEPMVAESEELLEEASTLKLEQKFGRNIASNIFHNIIKKAAGEDSHRLITAIAERHGLGITVAQFNEKLSERTKNLRGYVNMKTIRGLMTGRRIGATRLDLEFSKALRILSRHYLSLTHIPHIYHSSKIKKKSRQLHIKRMRKLQKLIQ